MIYQEVLLRLGIAVLAGGAIGYEREYKNRPAGFRTHILVCIGACVIALIQVSMSEEIITRVLNDPRLVGIISADYGRLSAQVISGIGFLGAGTIIHNKGSIKGLTTAATLWLVACLGLAIGYGYYEISLFALIICVLVLISLKKIQNKLFHNGANIKLEIEFYKKSKVIEVVDIYFASRNVHVIALDLIRGSGEELKSCIYTINLPRSLDVFTIIKDLSYNDNITEIRKIIED